MILSKDTGDHTAGFDHEDTTNEHTRKAYKELCYPSVRYLRFKA